MTNKPMTIGLGELKALHNNEGQPEIIISQKIMTDNVEICKR